MEKMYSQNDYLNVQNESLNDLVMDSIPDNIAPDQRIVNAILAYDKALSCMYTKASGNVSLILN